MSLFVEVENEATRNLAGVTRSGSEAVRAGRGPDRG